MQSLSPISGEHLSSIVANELLLTTMLQESTVGTAGALALRGVNRFFRDTIMSYQTWQRKIFARVITARRFY